MGTRVVALIRKMSYKNEGTENQSNPVTGLLAELRKGNKEAEAKLIPLVYAELHRLAGYYMRGEREGHTLQTSALVNEAYLRLAGEHNVDWKNRAHFFGMSAQIMRRILEGHARTRDAKKRGSPQQKVCIWKILLYCPDDESWQVVAIHEALNKLAGSEPAAVPHC